jgi:hypothetical protein
MEQVESGSLKRVNPEGYWQRLDEGYVRGVNEDRPAVISVNALMASLLINEFLARIHSHRNLPNDPTTATHRWRLIVTVRSGHIATSPPISVAQGFGVFRHCNDLDGQLLCVLSGRQPAQ